MLSPWHMGHIQPPVLCHLAHMTLHWSKIWQCYCFLLPNFKINEEPWIVCTRLGIQGSTESDHSMWGWEGVVHSPIPADWVGKGWHRA